MRHARADRYRGQKAEDVNDDTRHFRLLESSTDPDVTFTQRFILNFQFSRVSISSSKRCQKRRSRLSSRGRRPPGVQSLNAADVEDPLAGGLVILESFCVIGADGTIRRYSWERKRPADQPIILSARERRRHSARVIS